MTTAGQEGLTRAQKGVSVNSSFEVYHDDMSRHFYQLAQDHRDASRAHHSAVTAYIEVAGDFLNGRDAEGLAKESVANVLGRDAEELHNKLEEEAERKQSGS